MVQPKINTNTLKIDENIYEDNDPIMRSHGSRTFVGWNGDTSVKSHFTRNDFNYFRSTSEGRSRQKILRDCLDAYENIGIIQHVIDLMSDFGSKGISISHPDPELDNFCKKWFEKVSGEQRSERFLNSLYKMGSVVIYESLGRATNSITSKYIPIKYTFLNPAAIQVKGEDKGIIPNRFEYLIKYSNRVIRSPTTDEIQTVIPEELKKFQNTTKPLPNNKISVYNYRKDDWSFWGWPITHPILNDLKMLEKLKLSDMAALDGVISSVRLWTVGKITNDRNTTIIPTKPMLQKVRNMISQGVGGGSMDLVFGPELDFKESNTNVHQFLGEAKYKPTLDAIYDALGIPSILRSGNTSGGNADTGKLSLKTLIQRLNYGRIYLIDFWMKQIKKVFEIFGFKTDQDPIIEFDYMVLSDEAAEKKLLLDMIDRDIVDLDTVRSRFNMNSELIKPKLKGEMGDRGGDIPVKAGPYHNSHIEDDMKKTLLINGKVRPDEIGLDLDIPAGEMKERFSIEQQSGPQEQTGENGRPPNITETDKRKPKQAKACIWASQAQKEISEIYTPIVLKVYNKKNVRSLSIIETQALEDSKAKILFGMEPFEEITEESIFKSMGKEHNITELKKFISNFEDMNLTISQKRELISIFYGAENG